MRARILRPEEWPKVEECGDSAAGVLPFVEPSNIAVVVVEDDTGHVIGCLSAIQVTHLESLWISPEHRAKGGVLRALLRHAGAVPRVRGEHFVFGGAADEKMGEYIKRLGGRELPLRFYAMPIQES